MPEAHPPYAIVIGLDSLTGLQISRALARRGVPVIGITSNAQHYCSRTNACHKIIEAETNGDGLVKLLRQLGEGVAAGGILFPCTDLSVLTISQQRDCLEPLYPIDLPSHETVRLLLDKVESGQFVSEQCGLEVPRKWRLRSEADAERAAAKATFPCVLKPSVKGQAWEQSRLSKAFLIHDAAALQRDYRSCAKQCEELLLQEWIEGGDDCLFTCNAYYDASSQPLASFTTRKIRQWPPRIGTSCYSVEENNDTVSELTHKVFQAAGFTGLAYAEWKWDKNRGKFVFIEANVGRPTGRSVMAEAAGVELAKTKYCYELKLPLPRHKKNSGRPVQWVHWRRELQAAFYYWRLGELSAAAWCRSRPGRRSYAVLDHRDIRPFLAELRYLAGRSVASIWPWKARN